MPIILIEFFPADLGCEVVCILLVCEGVGCMVDMGGGVGSKPRLMSALEGADMLD